MSLFVWKLTFNNDVLALYDRWIISVSCDWATHKILQSNLNVYSPRRQHMKDLWGTEVLLKRRETIRGATISWQEGNSKRWMCVLQIEQFRPTIKKGILIGYKMPGIKSWGCAETYKLIDFTFIKGTVRTMKSSCGHQWQVGHYTACMEMDCMRNYTLYNQIDAVMKCV